MLSKFKLLFIIFILFIFSSCSQKINLTDRDKEDQFYYKSETRLIDTSTKKMIKKFISYENNEIKAKLDSLSLCQNFLEQNKILGKCKIFYHKFTLLGESALDD